VYEIRGIVGIKSKTVNFVTLRRKNMKRLSSVFVLVLTLAMLASVVQARPLNQYPEPGTSDTNIVVQNTSTTTGEVAAVTVEYYDTAGNLDYTNEGSVTIDPKAVKEIKTEDEPLGDGWQGSAVMSSDMPISAIVSIRNTQVPGAPDGYTQGAYNGSAEGAEKLYFPSLFGFQYIVSRITVQNVEGSQATIYASYYDRQGNYLGRQEDTIPAYSQKTLYLGNADDVPFNPDEFVDGSAVVTSTNKLAGAAVTTWGNRSAAYQALTDGNKGTTLYAPSHYRYMYDTSAYDPDDPDGELYTLFSALNLQNTSVSATANVTATYVSRQDGSVAMVKTFTIPPQSAAGLNTKNGGDFAASDFFGLSYTDPTNGIPDWDGSVTIESDQPLVGICNTNWDAAGSAGGYALVTAENDGASSMFIPAQYRIDWGAGWAQWAALNLMNVGESTITRADLSIEYIDTDGNTIQTFSGDDLPFDLEKGAAMGLNTRNGGDLDASAFNDFPTEGGLPRFIGGIYVSAPAGSNLVGVANIIYSNRASVYNAFPGE